MNLRATALGILRRGSVGGAAGHSACLRGDGADDCTFSGTLGRRAARGGRLAVMGAGGATRVSAGGRRRRWWQGAWQAGQAGQTGNNNTQTDDEGR